jgi:hypothetical protein
VLATGLGGERKNTSATTITEIDGRYSQSRCASRQSNRLAANKHRSTVPDVTAVTAILIRPATAVETADIGRSVSRSDFGLRFLAAMVILGRVRLHGSLIRTLPCQVDPDLSPASHAGSMKRLSEVVNQTLPMGMVYRFLRSHFAWRGGSSNRGAVVTPQRRYLATSYR